MNVVIAHQLMTELHKEQMYGKLAYTEHCIMVAELSGIILDVIGASSTLIPITHDEVYITGLLHDTIDDCLLCYDTANMLYSALFGDAVGYAITKRSQTSWKSSYKRMMTGICDIKPHDTSDIIAAIVKLADSLVNMQMCDLTNDCGQMGIYTKEVKMLCKAIHQHLDVDIENHVPTLLMTIPWTKEDIV